MSRPYPLIVVLAVLLTGCTGDPPAPRPPVNAPALPADVFPALPDRGNGVETTVEAMASDGEATVMVATVEGRTSVPVFRYSKDAGATWADGALSDAVASATLVGERALGIAAVGGSGAERRWLAVGDSDDVLFAWTSADAKTWERTPIAGIDADRGERPLSVTGLDSGGFVAAGGRWRDDVYRPMVWTSPDGIAWTARKVPGEGVLNEVVASGNRVVAVGERELPRVTKGRSRVSVLATSTDGGVRWRRVAVEEPATSGNFSSSLDHAVATPTGFVVGGSYYDAQTRGYRPLLLGSRDLTSWRPTPRLPDAGESSDIDELVQIGSATVAAQRSRVAGAPDEVRIWYLFPGDPQWTAGAAPKPEQSAWITAGAGAGEVAVFAVGVDGRPGRTAVWRFDSPARVADLEVTPPPGMRTRVQLGGLFVADGALAAHGRTQGVFVRWAADGAGFGAPTPLGLADDESVQLVTWSSDGGYLATGEVDGDHAFTMQSDDGTTWRRTAPKAFNEVAQYHSSEISDAIRFDGRWVVVGERSTNGTVRGSALVYSSTDGTTWTPGRPTKVTARGDWYGRRDPLDDLHGLDNRSRSMRAVAAAGRGLVAVGETGDGLTDPAAWVSRDGRTWRLVPLDRGDYVRARVSDVQRVGGALLATGWVLARGGTRTTRAMWRSTDDGEHWTLTTFEGTFTESRTAAGGAEFLQLVLADDHRTLTLWRSADGLAWTRSPVAVGGLADGMEVSLDDALVHDGALQLLLTVRNRLDAVTVVQRVPL